MSLLSLINKGKKLAKLAKNARVKRPGVGSGIPGEGTGRGLTKQEVSNNAQRKAILDYLKPIYDKAPKKDGKAILPNHWKNKELKSIVAKHPDLFPDGLTSTRMHDILQGSKSGKGKSNWVFNTVSKKTKKGDPAEQLLKNILPQYADESIDTVDKQYMVDVWRSRPADFRTGNFSKDVPAFLTFLRKQEFFNPKNKNTYFKSQVEYDDYASMRINQPKDESGKVTMHLAHDVPDLVPEGSTRFPNQTNTPFSGGEAGKTQYLEPDINMKVQPNLEQRYIGALADEDFSSMKKIDQEMADKNIRSTIVNPKEELSDTELLQFFLNRNKLKQKFGVNFEDYLSEGIYTPGKFSGGGLVKLLNKLKLTQKQKDLINRTAFSEKNKPGTGPKNLREEIIKKKIRDKYGKEKKWKYVKSEIEGPKSSLDKKKQKEFFKHTEFQPEKKKKAKGGIVSLYVR